MRKIKAIQIGIGHDHAAMAYSSILSQQDLFEVIGFVAVENEAQEFEIKYKTEFLGMEKKLGYKNAVKELSLEEALSSPELDCVVIETQEKNLTKYAIMAAEKGLAVYMDKPGGTDLDEFTRLIGILKQKQLPFSMGYMYRFNPNIQKAIQRVKSGELGEIYAIEAQMSCEHPKEKREWLAQFEGGMMFFLGCHLIDLIYTIQGAPQEVIAYNTSTGIDDVEAEDYGLALFRYKNGISIVKTCAFEVGGFSRRHLVICGTKGTIEINPLEIFGRSKGGREDVTSAMRETKSGGNWVLNIGEYEYAPLYNRYDKMMRNFAEIVCGKQNEYSYDYELELFKLVLSACGR